MILDSNSKEKLGWLLSVPTRNKILCPFFLQRARSCKSRIIRTHYISVCWEPLTFRTQEIFIQPLIFNVNEAIESHSYACNFRTKAAAYEIYENKKHATYSGFTVVGTKQNPC